MKNETPLKILKNLHSVLELAKHRYKSEYIPQDVELTTEFQESFSRVTEEVTTTTIEYLKHTSILRNKYDQVTYIPNQWFVIASYFVDFCTELLTYQRFFFEICKRKGYTKSQVKEYAVALRSCPTSSQQYDFEQTALAICKEKFPGYESEYEQVVDYLWTYATNYSWWDGSKTIDRGDSYESPLLLRMNLVAASSCFAAQIVNLYATNLDLRVIVDEPQNIAIGFVSNESSEILPEQNEVVKVERPTRNEEPAQKVLIKISAASLERFHSNL